MVSIHRQAQRDLTLAISQGQRYVLRELRTQFALARDYKRTQINILEQAFRGPVTSAVNKELNRLRRNAVVGDNQLRSLSEYLPPTQFAGLGGKTL